MADSPTPKDNAPARAQQRFEREFDYDRTVFFSDAVFAIAITLLVLSINLPDTTPGVTPNLWRLVSDTEDAIISYAISFAVIAGLWVRHHGFFRSIARVDMRLTALNLVYLGLVAFLPFPTKLLGLYNNQPAAPILYASTVLAITIVAGLERRHALRAELVHVSSRLPSLSRYFVIGGVFLISIPIAFASPRLAMYSWLLMPLARFTPRLAHRLLPTNS
jgi:uncharacterized membrane protein